MLARISLGIAAIMVGIVALAAYVDDEPSTDDLRPVATGEAGPAGLERFYQQDLAWSTCGGSLCTWVVVPLDYDEPDGRTTRLRVRLRPATSGDVEGRIVVNPGGPGGSGVDFVGAFAELASDDLLEHHDIVGFDPRGVGRSDPLTCLKDKAFDRLVRTDPDPDDADEIADLHRAFRSVGTACVNKSGRLASHVSTLEVARDLDVLRALMGQESLDYYGASYGTQIGSTYVTLFPQRAGAIVLDGAVDPRLDKLQQALGQARGFDQAFRSFLRACVRSAACPLGESVDEAEDKVVDLLDQLDDEPMRTRTSRTLTKGSALYGLAYSLYDPAGWSVLMTGLERASFGDGTILLRLGDQYYGREADGTYRDNGAQAGFAVRCLDLPAVPSDGDVASRLDDFVEASPVFGQMLAWTATECKDWPASSTNRQRAVRADGIDPVIVIGSTRDPATPYAWARSLTRQLASAVLVTRRGDGHTGYGVGNGCVDRLVERHLTDARTPASAVTCGEGS